MKPVSPDEFGKDHASLLAYVEGRCVDHGGCLERRHLMGNPERHPWVGTGLTWQPEYGTFLKNGKRLPKHDDWDCLEDLGAAGLLSIVSTANLVVGLTEKGIETAHRIRRHKIAGGAFGTFQWIEPKEE